jgi:hypothetical protein
MHFSYVRALAINQTTVKVLKIIKHILCLMSKKTIYNKKFFIVLSSLLFVVLIALFLSQVMRREDYLHFDSFDTEDNDNGSST